MTIKHIYPWIAITNVSGFICIIVFRRHDPGFLSFPVATCATQKKKKRVLSHQRWPSFSAISRMLCKHWISILTFKSFKRSEDEIRLGVREESWLQILQRLQTKHERSASATDWNKSNDLDLTILCVCVCVCVCCVCAHACVCVSTRVGGCVCVCVCVWARVCVCVVVCVCVWARARCVCVCVYDARARVCVCACVCVCVCMSSRKMMQHTASPLLHGVTCSSVKKGKV